VIPPVAYRLPVRVYWEDTDAGGVVYHANYLRFLERARTEWLRALGVDQDAERQRSGRVFVVHHVDAHYLKPARLDDLLEVRVGVSEARSASVVFGQSIWRGDIELLRARIRVACVDTEHFRPQRLDPDLLQRLHAPTHTATRP
jgi:acyl-CoA thioester hydrolase